MPEQRSENYGDKPPGRYRKRLLISIIAGVSILAGLCIYADVDAVGQAFAKFRCVYIPLILLLTLLNYLLRFSKWDYYLRHIGIKLRLKDSLAIFLSGLTMSVTPARLGEVFKSYLLKRLSSTEVSRTIPVVLAERITDVIGLVILAAISSSVFQYGQRVLIIILVILLALIVVLQSRQVCLKLLDLLGSIPLINRLLDSFRRAYETAFTLFQFQVLVVAVVLSVISWGFECLAMYLVLRGFGVDASVLLSTFIFSFSSLVGAVSMIPGGLVVAEGSFTGLMILFGVAKGIAATATVIIRLCTLWFGVTLGLITLFFNRRRF